MSSDPPVSAARSHEAQRAVWMAAVGAWTAIVPYLGLALGYDVNVSATVEVVDHVVPGAVVVAAGLYLRRLAARCALAGERYALLAAGASFLAGFWVFATHLPLLGDAVDAVVSWEAAIWHSIAGLPIAGLACWFVIRSIPEP